MKKKHTIEKIGLLLIVLIAIGLWGYFYSNTQADAAAKREAEEQRKETILKKALNPKSEIPVRYLTLEEAHVLYNSEQAIFMDARPVKDFAYMHIPGALSVPYTEAKQIQSVLDMDRDQLIVVYCSNRNCPMAEYLATRLSELHFKKVYIFEGGMQEWYDARYPLARGV